jgi:hypothetical protein
MSDQRDMNEIMRGFSHRKFCGTNHREKIGELLRHFQAEGLTLWECCDKRRLNRAMSTLQGYARDEGLVFPDYCPRRLKPRKDDAPETA